MPEISPVPTAPALSADALRRTISAAKHQGGTNGFRRAICSKEAATVINTTSLGMAGKPELPRAPRWTRWNRAPLVNDLVYNPLENSVSCLRLKSAGATIVDGLGMLLHQAVPWL